MIGTMLHVVLIGMNMMIVTVTVIVFVFVIVISNSNRYSDSIMLVFTALLSTWPNPQAAYDHWA